MGAHLIVYLRGEAAQRKASTSLFICPAADGRISDAPSEWLTEDRKPLQMEVEFNYGRAEVASNLGEYLVRLGLAGWSPLIIPDGVKVA